MKNNYNLPKIDVGINFNSGLTEKDCCLFPREQHPDTRSDREYMEMLAMKLLNNKFNPIEVKEPVIIGLIESDKGYVWYPAKRGRPRKENRIKTNLTQVPGHKPNTKKIMDALKTGEKSMTELLRITKSKYKPLSSNLNYYRKIGLVERRTEGKEYFFRLID